MRIAPRDLNLGVSLVKLESTGRKHQKHYANQKQHTPRWTELSKDCPGQLLQSVKTSLLLPLFAWRARLEVPAIQPETGACVLAELRPKLVHRQTFGYALPKLVEVGPESRPMPVLACTMNRRGRRLTLLLCRIGRNRRTRRH